MAPFLVYLLLLSLEDVFPRNLVHVAIVLHIVLALWVTWLFRTHLPPLGPACWGPAILVGLIAAAGWVAGQHLLNHVVVGGIDLGGRLPFYPGEARPTNPQDEYGSGPFFWAYAVLKITRACTAVPIVEELFWRGFILRAFVRWDHYDQVEWGRFHWRASVA